MSAELAREAREAADRHWHRTGDHDTARLLDRLAAALDGAPGAPDGLVERLRDAVRDEAGSQLCCWSEGGGTRSCGKDFGRPCLCMNVADAVVAVLPTPTPAPEPGVTSCPECAGHGRFPGGEKCSRCNGVGCLPAAPWQPAQDAGLIERAETVARICRECAEEAERNGETESRDVFMLHGSVISDLLAALKAAPIPVEDDIRRATEALCTHRGAFNLASQRERSHWHSSGHYNRDRSDVIVVVRALTAAEKGAGR